MILKIIFGQRKESYPGEFAPEALEVIDEIGDFENSEWITNKLEAHQGTGDFESLQIIEISIPQKRVMEILRPTKSEPIKGEVK